MDENGSPSSSSAAAAASEEIETSSNTNRSNKYDHLFMNRTLQFLVPICVLSFLVAYASCFSFIFTYNFHFTTLVFALFSRALERKYMFLICNGILAFLVKTLSFNSGSSSPSDPNFILEESMKTTETQEPTSGTQKSVPYEETAVAAVQYYSSISKNVAVEEEEKHGKEVYTNHGRDEQEQEEKEAECGEEVKSHLGSSLIIESDEIYSSEDDYEIDTGESAEAAASLLGASVSEEGNEINLNTEELNQRFEEFIRKMKEEIRIEAQQQLVVA